MKILGIFPAYEPAWAFGGVVRCTSNLFRAMALLGADVSVYTTNADGNCGLLKIPTGVPIDVGGVSVKYFLPTFGSGSVWDSREMMRTLNTTISSFDIVYMSAIWQWIGVAAARLAVRHQIPYIIGTHGSFDQKMLNISRMKKMFYYKLFLKRCIQNASAIHFTTEYERNESKVLNSEPPSFIVPNCIASEAFQVDQSCADRLRTELGVPNDAPLLMMAGRPDPKKRLDILLKAFWIVSEQFVDSRLMIVGQFNNAYGRRIKAISHSLGIDEKMVWAGYRTGAYMKACYKVADLFILPSIDENFGMVVAEAMACGLPVIVSDCVGIAEGVSDWNAGVVTKVDAEDIAKAIIRLLCDRSCLNQMSENAIKAAQQLYSGERVARMMLQAFEDVLSKNRSPQCAWR